MIHQLKEIVKCQKKIRILTYELKDKEYWIAKAREEAGFEPQEGDWISVKVESWGIYIYVYHKSGTEGAKYWINGQWFNTPFPKSIPDDTEILKL